jgi:hypothetical protein
MTGLSVFFGSHAGVLKIYVGLFQVGSGAFTVFNDSEVDFSGSYQAFGQAGTFSIRIQLQTTNGSLAANAGTCAVTLNAKTDPGAKYQIDSSTLTIRTTLNDIPVAVHASQGGTEIDGISGHNLWIGQWA